MMVKNEFDILMQNNQFDLARNILEEAKNNEVTRIINVGTSLIESKNCVALAKKFENIHAAIGIHPNDLNSSWKTELNALKIFLKNKKENKIVAIGECGIDMYRPGYDLQKQKDAFKAQIEIALENDLAIIVHSRNAPEETLRSLEEFHKEIKRCVIHCFSEGFDFANQIISWGFFLGIGGTLTYPKNNLLREISKTISLENIVLETDAPFLPPQIIRGQQNHPKYIKTIAQYLSEIRNESFEKISNQTSKNAFKLFALN
jgi:TatD DNase family protein